jgi:hypothetical protein
VYQTRVILALFDSLGYHWLTELLQKGSCVGIRVVGLCGIKFHDMLKGLWRCLVILVECDLVKS